MTYTIGNLTGAYLALLIPAAASGLLWLSVLLRRESYLRRFRGWRLAWETWGSSALITAALVGAFYWYLFANPFYRITAGPDGPWSLHYTLPAREVQIAPQSIRAIEPVVEQLPLLRDRRQYLRISLDDGRSFVSAPARPADAADLLRQLQAQRSSGAATR